MLQMPFVLATRCIQAAFDEGVGAVQLLKMIEPVVDVSPGIAEVRAATFDTVDALKASKK